MCQMPHAMKITHPAPYMVVTVPYLVLTAFGTQFMWGSQVRPFDWLQWQLHSIYIERTSYTKRFKHPAPSLVVTANHLVIRTLFKWVKCIEKIKLGILLPPRLLPHPTW